MGAGGFGRALLWLDGRCWNKKRVHRVYCEMGLDLSRRCEKRLADRPRQPLDCSLAPNRCWVLDFMHHALYCGRRFRTLSVIDEVNRGCLAGDDISGLLRMGRCARHRRTLYPAWQAESGCLHRALQPDEVLDAHLFANPQQVQAITDQWLVDYNEYRPHEALGGVSSPVQFMPRLSLAPNLYQPMPT